MDGQSHQEAGSLAKRLSLISRGTPVQFGTGLVLVSLIPLLALGYAFTAWVLGFSPGRFELAAVLVFVAVLMTTGLVILVRYPVNIVRLRRSLRALAEGELPKRVELIGRESDLNAIQGHMEQIVRQTAQRIGLIETQTQALLAAERHRVMIESLGAACHHLGQPMTVVMTWLNLIKRDEQDAEIMKMIDECEQAATRAHEILDRLKSVAEYRTEPYLPDCGQPADNDARILKI